MRKPDLHAYTDAFTAGTVAANGFPTAFHAGMAAALRLLLWNLAIQTPEGKRNYLHDLWAEVTPPVPCDHSPVPPPLPHGLPLERRRRD